MFVKPSLGLAALFSMTLALTGCAQTNGMTQAVKNAATETIGGFKTAIDNHNKSNNATSKKETVSAYYMFGWMEDGCIGDSSDQYKKMALLNQQMISNTTAVRETPIIDPVEDSGYEYYVVPKSKWHPGFVRLLDKVDVDVNYTYTEYHFKFKDNAFYRGQPLLEYQYKFRPESEGGEEVLKFAKNANVDSIWHNFKGRQVEDWMDGNMYESKATYNKQANTISCFLD